MSNKFLINEEKHNSLSGISKLDQSKHVGVGDSFQGLGKLNPTGTSGGGTQTTSGNTKQPLKG